ncbi:MAG: RagB/SusD family nutrient uptake outer membrane protein [Cytophagales bacterium]|nr:RagB/SusD family nutrient uptake outer membrane protein [Cytophagales bacterium]
MKTIKQIILLVALMAISTLACEELVDEVPEDRITVENFFTRSSDAEAAIIGAYNFSFRSGNSVNYLFFSTRSSDDMTAPLQGQESDRFMWRPNMTTDDGNVNGLWSDSYQALANINLVIQQVALMDDGVFFNEEFPELDRKSQIIAEAKFLRAWTYYNMVQYWGGVPLVTEPPTSVEPEDYRIPRATRDEIMALVNQDLDDAERDLPLNYDFEFTGAIQPDDPDAQPTQKGRATVAAAKMLKARIAMQNQDWENAIRLSREVIESGQYPLTERWVNIFDAEVQGSQNASESILEIQTLAGAGEFNNTGGYSWFTVDGRPRRGATLEAYDLFEGDEDEIIDVRKAESMTQRRENPNEIFAVKYANAFPWWNPDNGDPFNFIIFRATEAYLNIAEALNEQAYPNNEAMEIVNRIRRRAQDLQYNPPTPGIDEWDFSMFPDQASFRAAIREERRRELMFEGQRWWDMLRYDAMDNTTIAPAAVGLTNVAPNYNIDETRLLLPIPDGARVQNPELIQNIGYQ